MTNANNEVNQTQAKPVLPKDVAAAITKALADGKENYDIIEYAMGPFGNAEYQPADVISRWNRNNASLTDLMTALVNGYTVEQSPEEKVREYYESVRGQGDYGGITCEAIHQTLDLLDIKIQGVNA